MEALTENTVWKCHQEPFEQWWSHGPYTARKSWGRWVLRHHKTVIFEHEFLQTVMAYAVHHARQEPQP